MGVVGHVIHPTGHVHPRHAAQANASRSLWHAGNKPVSEPAWCSSSALGCWPANTCDLLVLQVFNQAHTTPKPHSMHTQALMLLKCCGCAAMMQVSQVHAA